MKWYEKALLQDAGQHEARRKLVELAVSVANFSAAKTNLLEFLIPYTPNDPRVYYLLGLCHEGLGEFGPAMKQLREAIDRDPTLTDAYSHLAILLRDQRKSSEDADSLMDQLVGKNGASAKAHIARADYRARYNMPGVLEDVREAVRLAPEDAGILFRATRTSLDLAVGSNDPAPLLAEAERYIHTGVARNPKFDGWYLCVRGS